MSATGAARRNRRHALLAQSQMRPREMVLGCLQRPGAE